MRDLKTITIDKAKAHILLSLLKEITANPGEGFGVLLVTLRLLCDTQSSGISDNDLIEEISAGIQSMNIGQVR